MWWERKRRQRRQRERDQQTTVDVTIEPVDADEHGADEEVFVMPIEDAIDLHHFHPAEILEIVDAYLEAAQQRGFSEVRLIHGRGKGVQRARVQRYLIECDRVLEFVDAPPGRGGWGATLVRLANPRDD